MKNRWQWEFQPDRLEHIRHIVAAIGGGFYEFIEVKRH
jgi:hypothetical protein